MASEDARVEHWDYKLEQWPMFRSAQPNPTHQAIVQLERAGRLECCVTQNIDGLHQKAGTSADKLVEVHGTNGWVECMSCGARSDPAPHFDRFERTRKPPCCGCGGWLKPATISFGQQLRAEDLHRAFTAADRADLVIALGSSLSVYPAAGIPKAAAERGVPLVVINRGETDFDGQKFVTLRLEGNVTDLFPAAVNEAFRSA
jgi:NAD-dependent deacetylase